jgi:DNA gyrase subunit A
MARKPKDTSADVVVNNIADHIIDKDFVELIDERFTNYAFAVMEDRALPDARDGLKPSQRRTMVAMNDLNLRSTGKTKKCAKICGDVSGNYHPHGEAVVYPTLVRMAQDWSLRYPLITPQGNFGSPAPEDKPAAMRYTEAKFSTFGDQMISELSDHVVDYVSNYNDELMEPTVLPSLVPNLIINGCSGIAVGWATSMAPHNYREVAKLIDAWIQNNDLTIDEVLDIMPGPDFPVPCKIIGSQGIRNYFTAGRGSVQIEGYYTIEQEKNSQYIRVTALPYGGSAEGFCREIKELVESKKIEGITNLKNLSNKKGMDVRVWVGKNANSNVILNLLLKHTSLRTNFSVNTTVLMDGKRVVENVPMLRLVEVFVNHRKEVLTRKFNAELDKNNRRLHILDGLIGITSKIDQVIKLIREADNREIAIQNLIANEYVTSQEQAEAVLKITLGNLTRLDTNSMSDEHDRLTKRNVWLTDKLSSDSKMLKLISKEQLELAEKIGDERRCELLPSADEMSIEDLIAEEQIIVSLTKDGYIKRVPLDTFRAQNRGGKGVIGVKSREEDEAADIFAGSTHDLFLFFTNQGNLLKKKGYEIPIASRTSKGTHLNNLLNLVEGEQVSSTITMKSLDIDGYFVMVTNKGLIKRSEIREYNTSLRKRGLKAITLTEGDDLSFVMTTDGNKDIMLVTAMGMAVRYQETLVRCIGKNGQGSRSMLLSPDDNIAAVLAIDSDQDPSILVVTELGKGKKTSASEYRSTAGRTVKGQRTINQSKREKTGKIVAALAMKDTDDILVLTSKGKIMRCNLDNLRNKSKATQANTIVSLDNNDSVQSVVLIEYSGESFDLLETEE